MRYSSIDTHIVRATEHSRTWRLPGTLSRMKKTAPTLRTGVTAMSSVAIALLQK
jgi:hypothetical protein